MAKKFIRHLEFYGFPDQNTYESEMGGGCNVDLSEIIKKNKEQDKEIQELTDEKASKKDLDELSGTVMSMIEVQSEINQGFAEAISGNTERIDSITDKVNEISDTVNDAMCGIQILGDRVDGLEGKFNVLSGRVDAISADTFEALADMQEQLDGKLGKDEAEEIYAKKEDVYTKQETDDRIDEKLEPYATKEWIQEAGYLTQEQADNRYAKKETVDALSDRVNSAVTDLNTKIYTVSGDLASFSSSTNARMGVLETNFEVLSGATDRKINNISATVESYDARINQNARDIDALEDEMARKANQSDLERLQNTVSNLSDRVDTKVSKTDFETYQSSVSRQFNDMDDKKLDKSAFTQALDAIDSLSGAIDTEREERISGDTYILNEITNIQNEIIEIKEQAVDYGDRIQDLEDGLEQEIADRKQADLDLIGTSADTKDDDTIWGAKAYAKGIKNQAITEANLYTDNEISGLRTEMENEFNEVEQALSGKADKEYVDGKVREAKAYIIDTLEGEINDEKTRAVTAENDLLARILENKRNIEENDDAIDALADKVNAVTEWDGHELDDYESWAAANPYAAGVLDVLHREFHEFEETGGSIKELRVEDGNLIVVYYTHEGEKEAVIPVGDLVDLSNYYDKDETDALLDEKVDVSAFTEISERVDYNTQNIISLSGDVEDEADRAISAETVLQDEINDTNDILDALINRLGYTDNDTLVRNGEREVAFGHYNISNASEDASGRTLFSIGNGTDDNNRSNALEVKENGDVYLWIEGEFMNINKLLGQIAHEVYDTDDETHGGHFFDGD